MRIEVAGPGCPRCKATQRNVHEALRQLGIDADVFHISDIEEMSKRGVTFTPAVIVDGQIKTSGKVPTVDELKEILSVS